MTAHPAERLGDAVAGAVSSVGAIYAIGFYLNDHGSVYNVPVLVALAVGAAPGVLLFFLLWRLARRPTRRCSRT
jgi:hypothetical protein